MALTRAPGACAQPDCARVPVVTAVWHGLRALPLGSRSWCGVSSTPWRSGLLLAAVALTIAVVVGAVWLIRRTVPATREGFHAEISAPMLGVVAALFGLLLAFVIITAYQNFIEAGADVDREADSLAIDSTVAFPEQDGERVRSAVRTYVRTVVDAEWGLMREGRDSLQASRG